MSQHGFGYHANRCTGCKTCMLACKDYHDLPFEIDYRQVYEYGGGTCRLNGEGRFEDTTFSYYLTVSCNHCDDPACIKVCPTKAMHRNELGLVEVDAGRCIGCGYCEFACPYGAPTVDRAAGHSVKCNGCSERVAEGKLPICVESCPMRALEFGEAADMAQVGERADIAPLPSKDYTGPNLYVRPCANAKPAGSLDGAVLNTLEVE